MGRSLSTPELNAGVSNIASAAGFAAGDYVYQQRTDTGPVPTGALSTGAFAYNNIPSTIFSTTSGKASNLTYVEREGGSTGGQAAAKLNNGNIVIVYARVAPGNYLNTAYFKILDSTGATVVAETAVSGAGTVAGRYSVSVCVLPNNNFVVAWTDVQSGTAWYPAFRIYQQTGVAVTSATVSTAAGTFNSNTTACQILRIKPRSDNSFIIAAQTSSTVVFFAGSSAGFSATFSGGLGYYPRPVWNTTGRKTSDFVIRSDDTIHIFYTNGANILCDVLATNGSATTSGLVIAPNGSNFFSIACHLTPSNLVYVFYYGNQTASQCAIVGWSWNGTTATSLGTLVSFSTVNTPVITFLQSAPQGGSGNFTLFYSHVDTGGALAYQVFNSSGALISGSQADVIPAISFPNDGYMQLCVFDIGAETRAYMTTRANSSLQANTGTWLGGVRGIYYFSYNSTTYNVNQNSSVNFNYGNAGALPLGAYVKSSSTPIEAAFTISASGTYKVSVPAGTNLVNKVIVSTSTSDAVSVIQLQNGNFAVSWSTGGSVFIKTYTPAGAEITSVTVASDANTSCRFCGMAPFANGTFAIIYGNTSSGISYKIYNNSLAQQFAGTISTSAITSNLPAKMQIATFGDGTQAAIAFQESGANRLEVRELTSGGVSNSVGIFNSTASAEYIQIVAYNSNSFGVICRESGATFSDYVWLQVYKTGPGTFVTGGPSAMGPTDDTFLDTVFGSSIPGPSTNALALANGGSGTTLSLYNPETMLQSSPGDFNRYQLISSGSQLNSGFAHAIGYTGNGSAVWATNRNSVSGYFIHYANIRPLNSNNTTDYGTGTVVNSGLATTTSTDYMVLSIAPHVEGAAVIAYLDNNRNPAFFVPVVQDCRISQTLTAGTDVSTTRLSLTPESGYVLRGVALTTASAGGSGLVQTKGVASVSASYQSITPTMNFDFRTSTATGVRGSITGRTVTLEG